jgi:hypothetical protein
VVTSDGGSSVEEATGHAVCDLYPLWPVGTLMIVAMALLSARVMRRTNEAQRRIDGAGTGPSANEGLVGGPEFSPDLACGRRMWQVVWVNVACGFGI